MRRSPIPFKFKVLRPGRGNELIFLPKLGEPEVEGLVSRLEGLGFGSSKVINVRPKVIRIAGGSTTLRLMPRGLLIGPRGTFERLGPSLDFRLRHEPADHQVLSWADNDYQSLAPATGGLVLHVRGRHVPSQKRFSAEISATGSNLSPDEAMMILATAEACGAGSVELLTISPGESVDLSQPIRLQDKGFLHRVEMSGEAFLSKADEIIGRCLGGSCPFSPLADSTIILRGASLPSSSRGLEDIASTLENWVFDTSYLSTTLGLD